MKKVILKIELAEPYKKSFMILISFNELWDCTLIEGGTNKNKAIISMPLDYFVKIFKKEPKKGKYKVPVNSESFISSVKVKKIIKFKK